MSNGQLVAFIPARGGSSRIPSKNIYKLAGHPLIAYSIAAAVQSGVFSRVIVSTDRPEIAEIGKLYGAEVPFLRPAEFAQKFSPDIDWVVHLLKALREEGRLPEIYSIIRPTSPFRQASTIVRAWKAFSSDSKADSLRAVEKCTQHPGKMWLISGSRMTPLMTNPNPSEPPYCNQPYQALPEIYVQNASLEIARSEMTLSTHSISGTTILPFVTEGYEGFDINFPEDLILAEHLVSSGMVQLPTIALN